MWTVYEQVCVAAVDCHMYELAESCLVKLSTRFQDSRRVRRLEGLLAEARRDWSRAEQVYKDILQDDPTSPSRASGKPASRGRRATCRRRSS